MFSISKKGQKILKDLEGLEIKRKKISGEYIVLIDKKHYKAFTEIIRTKKRDYVIYCGDSYHFVWYEFPSSCDKCDKTRCNNEFVNNVKKCDWIQKNTLFTIRREYSKLRLVHQCNMPF